MYLVFLPEMIQAAKRGDLGASAAAHPPVDQVQVVTRLGQQRKRTGFLLPPVPSDIGMGKVPISYLKQVLDDEISNS